MWSAAGTETLHIWGAQLETGTVATSYIPTVASTATRAADNVNVATSAFGFSATAGTVYADAISYKADDTVTNQFTFAFSDTGNDERIVGLYGTGQTARFVVTDGGATQVNAFNGSGWLPGVRAQATHAWAANDFAVSLNGASPTTDTSGTLPTITTLYLGSNQLGTGEHLNGPLRRFAYVPRRVP
jgi:hypothetical protein